MTFQEFLNTAFVLNDERISETIDYIVAQKNFPDVQSAGEANHFLEAIEHPSIEVDPGVVEWLFELYQAANADETVVPAVE